MLSPMTLSPMTFMGESSVSPMTLSPMTFMGGNVCCSGKHLHKGYLIRTSYLVHSIPIQRNRTLDKYFGDCCISKKVLLSTRRVTRPTFRANAGTSISIDQIWDTSNTKETAPGFKKFEKFALSIDREHGREGIPGVASK